MKKRIASLILMLAMVLFLFPVYIAAASEEVTPEDLFKSTVLKYFNDVEKLKYNQEPLDERGKI